MPPSPPPGDWPAYVGLHVLGLSTLLAALGVAHIRRLTARGEDLSSLTLRQVVLGGAADVYGMATGRTGWTKAK